MCRDERGEGDGNGRRMEIERLMNAFTDSTARRWH